MRISVTDLPPDMQKQVLRKLAEEERRTTAQSVLNELDADEKSGEKRSKYHAKKVTLSLPDGSEHTFDSKHEAAVYQELELQQQCGEISDLRLQIPYLLIERQKAPSGKVYRSCSYIADFVYKDKEGNTVVADAKGMKTQVYLLKKKLMLKVWGIEIKEV